MSALWPTADNGRLALDYFGSSSVTDMATIIVTLSALLPVAHFAPGYVNWMRNPTATVAIFAVTFESVYPALHARLVAVGSRVGIECQQEIRSLAVELYGVFSGQLHPVFIQALMLYVWCSPGSPQADLLNSMLGDYLDTAAPDLVSFRAACGDMRSMHWSSKAAGSVFSAQQLSQTQGHMRLDPAMSPRNFYAQWVFLWTCAVETMTRSRFESSPTHALRHIEVASFTPQAEKEDFKQFVARIQVACERTRAEPSLLGRADMLPHEDTLVHLVYSRALRSISVKVQTMLRTTESYSERDLTMGTVVSLYMRAAYRREQNFSGIDSALRSSAPQRPAE